MDMSRLNYTK